MDEYTSSWASSPTPKQSTTLDGMNNNQNGAPERVTEGREQNNSSMMSQNRFEQRAVSSLNPFDAFDLNKLYVSPNNSMVQASPTSVPEVTLKDQPCPSTNMASGDTFVATAEPPAVSNAFANMNQFSAASNFPVQTSESMSSLPETVVPQPSYPSIQTQMTPTTRNPRPESFENTQPYDSDYTKSPPVAALPQLQPQITSTAVVESNQPTHDPFGLAPVLPSLTPVSGQTNVMKAVTNDNSAPLYNAQTQPVVKNNFMKANSQAVNDPFSNSITLAAPQTEPAKASNEIVASHQSNNNPFAVSPPSSAPPAEPVAQSTSTVVLNQPNNYNFAAPPSAPSEAITVSTTVPGQSGPNTDPFGMSQQANQFVSPTAIVPSTIPNEDIFGVFNGYSANTHTTMQAPMTSPQLCQSTAPQSTYVESKQQHEQENVDDFWASMGFSLEEQKAPVPTSTPNVVSPSHPKTGYSGASTSATSTSKTDGSLDMFSPIIVENEIPAIKRQTWDGVLDPNTALPSGGKFYEARIHTRSLGATFMAPMDMKDGVYRKMSLTMIESLRKFPTVSYVISGSSADCAGLKVGFIIARINNEVPPNPKIGAAMIQTASRPLTLTYYVPPNLDVDVTERQCEVKYDNKELIPPPTYKEWKPKYLVLGGLISKPHILSMYRSMDEFDVAVKETYSGKAKSVAGVSVKVKQFDLRGARILAPGIQRTRYEGYPIKIASHLLDDLQAIYFEIARFIKEERNSRDDNRVLDHRAENHSKRAHAKAVKRGILDLDINTGFICGL